MAPIEKSGSRKRRLAGASVPGVTAKRRRSETLVKQPSSLEPEDGADDQDSGSEDDTEANVTRILAMEAEILASKKNYNAIPELIQIAGNPDGQEQEAYTAAVALTRVFLNLLANGRLIRRPEQGEKDAIVVNWLRTKLEDFETALVNQVRRQDEFTKAAVLMGMKLVQAESKHMSEAGEYSFPHRFFNRLFLELFAVGGEAATREFVDKFVGRYADLRFYVLKQAREIPDSKNEADTVDEVFDKLFALLSAIGLPTTSKDNPGEFYVSAPKKRSHDLNQIHQHKKQGQEAWLALMKLAETKEQRKRILDVLTTLVAPWFARPELLADFLTDAYDSGGSTSILALSGVFYLIRERNLDYPSFYPKLYSLLDEQILHSKHRSRLFRLLDTFLASTHLPAALVASFIKRLSRLALNAPPGAIVFAVPWIYNLLRRHPQCTFMIHREPRTAEERAALEEKGLDDPFDPGEADPLETGAVDSCLWELVQLQSHYHPNVATIAKIISEQFTKASYNIEDFLDHSYSSLLEAELAKDVKKTPVVEFQIPKRILLRQDEGSDLEDSLLVRLWDFGDGK